MRPNTINPITLLVALAMSIGMYTPNAKAQFPFLGLSLEPIETNRSMAYETYRLYVNLAPGARLDAVFGNADSPMSIGTTGHFYQHQYGGATSQQINSDLFLLFPDLEWDSYITIGCLYENGYPFSSNELDHVGISQDLQLFEYGEDLFVPNGSWFITPNDEQGMEQRGRVLIGQFTIVPGAPQDQLTVLLNLQGKDHDFVSWQALQVEYTFNLGCSDIDNDGVCDDEDGCPNDPNKTDPGACGCGVADTNVNGDVDCDGDYDEDDIRLGMADFGIYIGDLDGDGDVDADDYAALAAKLGICQGDLNGDGQVDGGDMGLLIAVWGPCLP